MAFRVHVAGGLGSAHGDAEHGVVVHAHGSGEGGHFTVVHHFKGDVVPFFLLQGAEHLAQSLFNILLAHAAEEGGGAHLAVDDDAGGGAADGVHARKMGGGAFQGVLDALNVVLRVLLEIRVPHDFFGENHFPVDHGGALAVGAAQVKADAVAVQIAAQRHGAGIFLRQFLHGYLLHLNRGAVNLLADEVPVKLTDAALAVAGGQHVRNGVITGNKDDVAALLPQQEFHDAFHIGFIQGNVFSGMGEKLAGPAEAGPVIAGQGDIHLMGGRIGSSFGFKCLIPKNGRHKAGVQHGRDFGLNIHGDNPLRT